VALVALLGGVASACSSDRVALSDSPFSNPFGTSNRVAAAEPQAPAEPTAVAAVPTATVQSQALPPVSAQAAAPVQAPRVASSAPVTSSAGGWTATGGTRVTVGANDSLNSISQRYGVPTNAILAANGFGNASQVQVGREIVIPVYNASGQAVAASSPAASAPSRAAAPVSAPARAAAPAPAKEKLVFVVGPKPAAQKPAPAVEKAEASEKIAKVEKTRTRPGMATAAKPASTEVAAAKPAPAPAVQAAAKPAPAVQVAAPKPVPAPAVQVAAAKPAPAPVVKPAPVPAPQAEVVAQKPAEPVKVAKIEPQPLKAAPAPVPAVPAFAATPQPEAAKAPVKEVTETASLPSGPATDFRWPARGRVIAGFGANGGNEGINIALPEGTPVKATDDGTVTYVGGDVKAYGNLVLIKHDNGYVSAYAHNGEIAVKRGERVRRGQVVAKSGQSGNVTSPQLHFEIRKGQAAVDPLAHLNGG